MQDIEAMSYMLLFGLGLIFIILGVSRKSSVYCFLGFIPWFALGMVQPYMATGTPFVSLSYLWYAIGVLSIIFGGSLVVMSFLDKREREEWTV